jgi:hypothetical protein
MGLAIDAIWNNASRAMGMPLAMSRWPTDAFSTVSPSRHAVASAPAKMPQRLRPSVGLIAPA